jgi:hypothetical protein
VFAAKDIPAAHFKDIWSFLYTRTAYHAVSAAPGLWAFRFFGAFGAGAGAGAGAGVGVVEARVDPLFGLVSLVDGPMGGIVNSGTVNRSESYLKHLR